MAPEVFDVAILGAGASGSLLCVHLAPQAAVLARLLLAKDQDQHSAPGSLESGGLYL